MFKKSAFLFTLFAGGLSAAQAQNGAVTRLPEVTSTASRLLEDQPADETGRPDWTSARRFTTTRVYIQQAQWEVGFEQWLRYRDFRDGTTQARFQEEIEIGLPCRFQLDFYENWVVDEHRRADQDEFSVELRWALANWGKIPLNPTLYAEYATVNQAPNTVELKLLLGQDLAPRLHWGVNFVWEQETSGASTTEFQVSQGVSYTLIDQLLSAGVEMKYVHETDRFSRHDPEQQFLIGPSVQIRPSRNTHLDLVALIGTNKDSPNLEGYIVFGIDFGKITGGGESHYEPASVRGN